jgi:hypothetical protein
MGDDPTTSTLLSSTIPEELQEILSGLIGGALYGIRIRLPHAAVMTFLFRSDLNASQKLSKIFRMSFEHSSKLAVYASLYKLILVSLKFLSRHLQQDDFKDSTSSSKQNVFKSLGRLLLSMIGE